MQGDLFRSSFKSKEATETGYYTIPALPVVPDARARHMQKNYLAYEWHTKFWHPDEHVYECYQAAGE